VNLYQLYIINEFVFYQYKLQAITYNVNGQGQQRHKQAIVQVLIIFYFILKKKR
jgi:hypothetical protein